MYISYNVYKGSSMCLPLCETLLLYDLTLTTTLWLSSTPFCRWRAWKSEICELLQARFSIWFKDTKASKPRAHPSCSWREIDVHRQGYVGRRAAGNLKIRRYRIFWLIPIRLWLDSDLRPYSVWLFVILIEHTRSCLQHGISGTQ